MTSVYLAAYRCRNVTEEKALRRVYAAGGGKQEPPGHQRGAQVSENQPLLGAAVNAPPRSRERQVGAK